jgi:hypothetical protein
VRRIDVRSGRGEIFDRDAKAGEAGEAEVEVPDTREKRPKVANSLRSLRLTIAEKMKKAQDDRKTMLLAKEGFKSDDEEE